MIDAYLQLKNIKKTYENTCILKEVSLDVARGEVCVLLGENGSGKSTLAKILSGAIMPDSGDIIINGNAEKIKSTKDARKLGIGIVYQDTVVIDTLPLYENVFLGMEKFHEITRVLNDKKMMLRVESLIKKYNLDINCMEITGNLSYAQKQYIQLLRIFISNPDIVIFDEITASLTDIECGTIFNIVKLFKQQGKCIIFITHKPNDVKAIGDSIYVLKDGEIVGIKSSTDAREDELIQLMLGKDIKDHFPKLFVNKGDEILRVENFSGKVIKDISFNLYEGEILGITGLVGSGKTSIIESILGLQESCQGNVYLQGNLVKFKKPLDYIHYGIGYIPENGDKKGLFLDLSISHNISISNLEYLKSNLQINKQKENFIVNRICIRLGMKGIRNNNEALYLSSGNRQKVNLARWIITKSNLFILDEPTMGVDINGKVEIYNLMNELIRRGAGIIMVSSNLAEVAGMCDRILIIKNGQIHVTLRRAEATQEKIFRLL